MQLQIGTCTARGEVIVYRAETLTDLGPKRQNHAKLLESLSAPDDKALPSFHIASSKTQQGHKVDSGGSTYFSAQECVHHILCVALKDSKSNTICKGFAALLHIARL